MQIASNKISEVIKFFRQELKDLYDAGEIDTFITYCFEVYLNFTKTDLLLKSSENMSESELLKFSFAVKQLKQFRPIQYILGNAHFYKLNFIVTDQVLIPRPETEELVNVILHDLKEKNTGSILDIGTGSGCIAVALKKNKPAATVYAMDISETALELAKQNAKLNQTDIVFFQQDILNVDPASAFSALHFDTIVSNPPYICISEKEDMSKNVVDYEPHLALFVQNDDPLLFYKAIADFSLKRLANNGYLYFEINALYGAEVIDMLKKRGFENLVLMKDLNNKSRMLRGTVKRSIS